MLGLQEPTRQLSQEPLQGVIGVELRSHSSLVKSSYCVYGGSEFWFPAPTTTASPAPGDLAPSAGLYRHFMQRHKYVLKKFKNNKNGSWCMKPWVLSLTPENPCASLAEPSAPPRDHRHWAGASLYLTLPSLTQAPDLSIISPTIQSHHLVRPGLDWRLAGKWPDLIREGKVGKGPFRGDSEGIVQSGPKANEKLWVRPPHYVKNLSWISNTLRPKSSYCPKNRHLSEERDYFSSQIQVTKVI